MTRPRIAADLAAALTAALPARLAARLDAAPTLAERWTWAAGSVTTDRGDLVTLTVRDDVVTAVACSCLLAPRCLHVAAVVALLEPAADAAGEDAALGGAGEDAALGGAGEDTALRGAGEDTALRAGEDAALGGAGARSPADVAAVPPGAWPVAPGARPAGAAGAQSPADAAAAVDRDVAHAAHAAFRVVADVLAAGAEASGAFAQAELLRSIHACRSAGLHRLAAAQTRALRSIRDLRADRPAFALPALTADVREALAVAHALAAGDAAPAHVGTARRDYQPVGNLHLRGVLSEAVVARSGYAGAVTYLIDDAGALYTRADVAPGDAARAAGAYDAATGIGDAVLAHRELCRAGLFVVGATASADGRLGSGHHVRAVRAREPARWDREPVASRFARPLVDQLAQLAARDGEPAELRPAGWDLVFVEGVVVSGGGAVGAVIDDTAIRFTTGHDHPALPARDNLAVLARAPGLVVRAIGRARLAAPRELDLLAIGPGPGEQRFAMPDAWHGRANLHYDRLALAALGEAPAIAVAPPLPGDDLLAPLRRRVERAVLGGAGTLPVHALGELEREAAVLADQALRGGADVLRDLAAFAHDAARSPSGARRPLDHAAFARAWLRAALYEDAARRRLAVASW